MDIRTLQERRHDTRALLDREEDLWIASADASANVHLIPLSFSWTGEEIVLATPESSKTVRNLRRAGRTRLAIGPSRDVVIIEGPVRIHPADQDLELCRSHALKVGFDASTMFDPWVLIRVRPDRIMAWRNPAELPGRDILADGSWLR